MSVVPCGLNELFKERHWWLVRLSLSIFYYADKLKFIRFFNYKKHGDRFGCRRAKN